MGLLADLSGTRFTWMTRSICVCVFEVWYDLRGNWIIAEGEKKQQKNESRSHTK